jgi:hypothetical protein
VCSTKKAKESSTLSSPQRLPLANSSRRSCLVRRMTTELRLLVASVILGLVQLIAASHLISAQYGYRWTGGSRDEPVPPLHGLANRVDQATTNFLETFPFFAALVFDGTLHEPSWLTDTLGRTPVFLGAPRLFTCRGARIRPCSFGRFLEYRSCRHGTLSGCAFNMTPTPNQSRGKEPAGSQSHRSSVKHGRKRQVSDRCCASISWTSHFAH